MNARCGIAGVVAMVLAAGPARAQPGVEPAPPPAEPVPAETATERYGLPIAVFDGVAVAMVGIGAYLFLEGVLSKESSGTALGAMMVLGAGATYTFAGPLIHVRHHNTQGAGKSLALRVGLPLVGVIVGGALRDDAPEDGATSGDDYSAKLVAVGVAAAMVIDWLLLAKQEVRVATPVMPFAAPVAGGGVTFGLGGAF